MVFLSLPAEPYTCDRLRDASPCKVQLRAGGAEPPAHGSCSAKRAIPLPRTQNREVANLSAIESLENVASALHIPFLNDVAFSATKTNNEHRSEDDFGERHRHVQATICFPPCSGIISWPRVTTYGRFFAVRIFGRACIVGE